MLVPSSTLLRLPVLLLVLVPSPYCFPNGKDFPGWLIGTASPSELPTEVAASSKLENDSNLRVTEGLQIRMQCNDTHHFCYANLPTCCFSRGWHCCPERAPSCCRVSHHNSAISISFVLPPPWEVKDDNSALTEQSEPMTNNKNSTIAAASSLK